MKSEKEIEEEKKRIESILKPEEGSAYSEIHISSRIKRNLHIKLDLINWILT